MSIHHKATLAAVMILTLVAGCVAAEPTRTSVPPTDTPVPPTATPLLPTSTPTATSIPPTEAPTPSPTPTVGPFERISDVSYITAAHPRQKLDLYLPMSGDGPFPTLLMMHGGGGDKLDMSTWARHFAAQDYAVVSISYRDQAQNDYPAPVQDAFCALAWIHANAGTYGFDPGRIVALGYSTGGTLAAMLGTVDDPALFTEDCPHLFPEEDRIQGAISFAGTFDYVSAAESPQSPPWLRQFFEDYLAAPLGQSPEIWAEASATTWVDGSEPPFLLIHGAEDRTIGPKQSVSFADALKQAGVDVELLLIPDADHRMVISSEQSYQAVEDFLAALAGQGALSSGPTGTAPPAVMEVTFTTQDGIKLSGTLFGEGDIAVILAHQGTFGADQTTWQPFAQLLAEQGFAALTFDFRGVGQSEGKLSTSRLIYDINAATDFLRERGYDRIACVGASMGGTACLRAALDQQLVGLVVLASTKSIGSPTVAQDDELAHLNIPKLFLTASGDHSMVVNDTTKMYENSPEPKVLHVFQDMTEHGTDLFNTDVHDELTDVLLTFITGLP